MSNVYPGYKLPELKAGEFQAAMEVYDASKGAARAEYLGMLKQCLGAENPILSVFMWSEADILSTGQGSPSEGFQFVAGYCSMFLALRRAFPDTIVTTEVDIEIAISIIKNRGHRCEQAGKNKYPDIGRMCLRDVYDVAPKTSSSVRQFTDHQVELNINEMTSLWIGAVMAHDIAHAATQEVVFPPHLAF